MLKMRALFCLFLAVLSANAFAQTRLQKIKNAWQVFVADSQMKHAIAAFTVYDSKTGKILFDQNGQKGLAPASTQKIVTSVAAFEMLGKGFTYKTVFRIAKNASSEAPVLEIIGSGDPTLGSWRYAGTTDSVIVSALAKRLQGKASWSAGSNKRLLIAENNSGKPLPGGYTWEDMGNYYGAGSRQFNWRENQYDLYFNSDNDGNTTLIKTDPEQLQLHFKNRVRGNPAISSDEIYVYAAPYSIIVYLEGEMPANKKNFMVSGSMPDPARTFSDYFAKRMDPTVSLTIDDQYPKSANGFTKTNKLRTLFDTVYLHQSPVLDSINFHFLRRSINLYGESLVKAIALQKKLPGTTENGVEEIQDFFEKNGIDKASLNIVDGSGLSPQNRVTSDALARVLLYAKGRPWFSSFYLALPEYNGMKMKSGSIGGARAFAGYYRATDSSEYTFSIIVNNFDGSAGSVVRKIYKLLDALK